MGERKAREYGEALVRVVAQCVQRGVLRHGEPKRAQVAAKRAPQLLARADEDGWFRRRAPEQQAPKRAKAARAHLPAQLRTHACTTSAHTSDSWDEFDFADEKPAHATHKDLPRARHQPQPAANDRDDPYEDGIDWDAVDIDHLNE